MSEKYNNWQHIIEQQAESYGEITIIPSRIHDNGDPPSNLIHVNHHTDKPMTYIQLAAEFNKKIMITEQKIIEELLHQAEMYLKDPLFVPQDLRDIFDKIYKGGGKAAVDRRKRDYYIGYDEDLENSRYWDD